MAPVIITEGVEIFVTSCCKLDFQMGLVKALEDTTYQSLKDKEWTEMEKWCSTLQRYTTLFRGDLWSFSNL